MAYNVRERYEKLNDILLSETAFFKAGQVDSVEFKTSEDFVEKLRARIKQAEGQFLMARHKFGDRYEAGYVDPLLKNLEGIFQRLTTRNADDGYDPIAKYVFLTQIVNAALQPGENSTASALRPIQNFVDDMYSSFLNARTGHPRDHKIPPLVSLVDWLPSNVYNLPSERKPPMPGVLEIDQMKDLLKPDLAAGFAAGSVLLPPGYRNRPLLWGVLGHEVGGHYVLTSDPKDKLINELQGKIYIAMRKLYTEKPFDVLAPLWYYWTEEAAADACSVLNLGPTALGALAFYTAIRKMSGYWAQSELESRSPIEDDYQVWDHPVPVLIPDVACGAIEGLRLTQVPEIGITQIKEIAERYIHDKENVHFPPGSWVKDPNNGDKIQLPDKLPLAVMQQSARTASLIVTEAPLKALDGRALGDLITWNDHDEKTAIGIADQLCKQITSPNSKITITIDSDKVGKRHLLAGGILAVMRQPEAHFYQAVNAALVEEFARN